MKKSSSLIGVFLIIILLVLSTFAVVATSEINKDKEKKELSVVICGDSTNSNPDATSACTEGFNLKNKNPDTLCTSHDETAELISCEWSKNTRTCVRPGHAGNWGDCKYKCVKIQKPTGAVSI